MLEYEVRLYASGYVGVRFCWASMTFRAEWSNPLWELVGSDVAAQLDLIGEKVRSSVATALFATM